MPGVVVVPPVVTATPHVPPLATSTGAASPAAPAAVVPSAGFSSATATVEAAAVPVGPRRFTRVLIAAAGGSGFAAAAQQLFPPQDPATGEDLNVGVSAPDGHDPIPSMIAAFTAARAAGVEQFAWFLPPTLHVSGVTYRAATRGYLAVAARDVDVVVAVVERHDTAQRAAAGRFLDLLAASVGTAERHNAQLRRQLGGEADGSVIAGTASHSGSAATGGGAAGSKHTGASSAASVPMPTVPLDSVDIIAVEADLSAGISGPEGMASGEALAVTMGEVDELATGFDVALQREAPGVASRCAVFVTQALRGPAL